MELAESTKTTEPAYTINDAVDVLIGNLDEAIDDMKNGRVRTIEEAWGKSTEYSGTDEKEI